jgi:hypothetical protein
MKTETMKIEVLNVERTSLGTRLTNCPDDVGDIVSLRTDKVKRTLSTDKYQHLSEKLKLAERNAYTFEQLLENAMKKFYPEAYIMRTIKHEDLLCSSIKTEL